MPAPPTTTSQPTTGSCSNSPRFTCTLPRTSCVRGASVVSTFGGPPRTTRVVGGVPNSTCLSCGLSEVWPFTSRAASAALRPAGAGAAAAGVASLLAGSAALGASALGVSCVAGSAAGAGAPPRCLSSRLAAASASFSEPRKRPGFTPCCDIVTSVAPWRSSDMISLRFMVNASARKICSTRLSRKTVCIGQMGFASNFSVTSPMPMTSPDFSRPSPTRLPLTSTPLPSAPDRSVMTTSPSVLRRMTA